MKDFSGPNPVRHIIHLPLNIHTYAPFLLFWIIHSFNVVDLWMYVVLFIFISHICYKYYLVPIHNLFIKYKFIYFILFIFGCVGSSLLRAGFLQLRRAGSTLRCRAQASHCSGFSCSGPCALGARASVAAAHGLAGSRAQAQQLWHTGLVVPRHVGSSVTRDRTRVPCISRRIPNHCATSEVPLFTILNKNNIFK